MRVRRVDFSGRPFVLGSAQHHERSRPVGTISGSSTAEIEAPIETVWAAVEDVLSAPEWQGEMKSVDGSWELEDLGDGRTRATYNLEVDLGRMLGLVIRGPLVDVLRGQLVNARAGELKAHVEGG